MGGGVTGAMAAIMGAFVGGLGSLARTWVGERSRFKRDLLQRDIANREDAYSEFIEWAAKLHVASAIHRIDEDDADVPGIVSLYAIAGRIRLLASDQVVREAEKVMDRIIMQYGDDNISAEELRTSTKKDDPLRTFSVICRRELQGLQRGL